MAGTFVHRLYNVYINIIIFSIIILLKEKNIFNLTLNNSLLSTYSFNIYSAFLLLIICFSTYFILDDA
ncbi:hypothetical protein J3Q64DRAFT_1771112 [Phycomyces blakesleeanus]|uniref:Uncharacterized protein n=1 Tax=Phycomyces blakesleeanus TaxID=4837 RepID=A0ABR3AKQ8_PHYBL